MRFLTVKEVIELHQRIILQSGDAEGIRDMGLLESAVAQPRMTFEGQDLHPTLVERATALGFALIRNHPFLDGNKRISHAATEVFLVLNGFELCALVGEHESFVIGLASGDRTKDDLAAWIELFLAKKVTNRESCGHSAPLARAIAYGTDAVAQRSKLGPSIAHVGIFYFIRGISHWIGKPFSEVEAVAGIVDLDLSHKSFWDRVVQSVPEFQGLTYEHFPRGRVLMNEGRFEIHVDQCLASDEQAEVIKHEMDLPPETLITRDDFYSCVSCR